MRLHTHTEVGFEKQRASNTRHSTIDKDCNSISKQLGLVQIMLFETHEQTTVSEKSNAQETNRGKQNDVITFVSLQRFPNFATTGCVYP